MPVFPIREHRVFGSLKHIGLRRLAGYEELCDGRISRNVLQVVVAETNYGKLPDEETGGSVLKAVVECLMEYLDKRFIS